MEIYSFNINNNPYEVNIVSIKKRIAEVEVNGVHFEVDISDIEDIHLLAQRLAKPADIPKESVKTVTPDTPITTPITPVENKPAKTVKAGANDIAAPMPGLIKKILVSEGDSLEPGDIVVIMEAMKMENQIKSTTNGKVTQIHIDEGDTVAEGALLVSLGGE